MGGLKWLRIIITQQNMAPWCSDTIIVFLAVSNDWELSSTEKFVTNMYFEYELDADSFWIKTESLSSRAYIVLECVSAVNVFLLVMSVFQPTCRNYMKGWSFWRRISGVVKSISVLFSEFLSLANSIGHGWWAIIYCCIFWNYEILLKCFEIAR